MSWSGVCCLVFTSQTGINKACISLPPACSELRDHVIEKASWAMETWPMDYEFTIKGKLG